MQKQDPAEVAALEAGWYTTIHEGPQTPQHAIKGWKAAQFKLALGKSERVVTVHWNPERFDLASERDENNVTAYKNGAHTYQLVPKRT